MSETTADSDTISLAVSRNLAEAAGRVDQALAWVSSAHATITELAGDGWLMDPDLAETGAGDDALDRLAQAAAALRDVARIIENRQLREQAGVLGAGR
jgi:hypothetical protein